jgi:hypothetical protein
MRALRGGAWAIGDGAQFGVIRDKRDNRREPLGSKGAGIAAQNVKMKRR